MVGINFVDKQEAEGFGKVVMDTLDVKARKREDRKCQQLKTNSLEAQLQNQPHPQKSRVQNNIQLSDITNRHQVRKARKTHKIRKDQIWEPTNSQHITHEAKGFSPFIANDKLNELLKIAGVSQHLLQNKKTRKFINDFIDQHGGMEQTSQKTKEDGSIKKTPTDVVDKDNRRSSESLPQKPARPSRNSASVAPPPPLPRPHHNNYHQTESPPKGEQTHQDNKFSSFNANDELSELSKVVGISEHHHQDDIKKKFIYNFVDKQSGVDERVTNKTNKECGSIKRTLTAVVDKDTCRSFASLYQKAARPTRNSTSGSPSLPRPHHNNHPQTIPPPPPPSKDTRSSVEKEVLPPPSVRIQSAAAPPPPASVRIQSVAAPPPPSSVRIQSAAAPPPPPPPASVIIQSVAAPPPPSSVRIQSAAAPPPPPPPPPASVRIQSVAAPPPPSSVRIQSAAAPPPPPPPPSPRIPSANGGVAGASSPRFVMANGVGPHPPPPPAGSPNLALPVPANAPKNPNPRSDLLAQIRQRPTLNPVSERQIETLELDLRTTLMREIKNRKYKLKPVTLYKGDTFPSTVENSLIAMLAKALEGRARAIQIESDTDEEDEWDES